MATWARERWWAVSSVKYSMPQCTKIIAKSADRRCTGYFDHPFSKKPTFASEKTAGTAMGHGGEFNHPPANPLQAGFFVIGQSRQIISSRGEAPSEFFCWRLHRLPL